MACLTRCGLTILLFLAVVAGAAAIVAYNASDWLSAADSPAKADAIIVLGSEPTRAITGAGLYTQGFASVVYLTVPMRPARWVALERDGIRWPWFDEAGRVLLRNRGVPDAAIRTLGNDLLSTVAEAREAARVLGHAGTLLVVTSPYHVYRTRLIFSDHLSASRILVVASGAEPLPTRWWTDREGAANVASELGKLLFYKLGFAFT